jgi:hypothetical protein
MVTKNILMSKQILKVAAGCIIVYLNSKGGLQGTAGSLLPCFLAFPQKN